MLNHNSNINSLQHDFNYKIINNNYISIMEKIEFDLKDNITEIKKSFDQDRSNIIKIQK